MKLSWAMVFVAVIVIVVSNYIHEIKSHSVEDDEVNLCEGFPSTRELEGEGYLCTKLEKNFLGKAGCVKTVNSKPSLFPGRNGSPGKA